MSPILFPLLLVSLSTLADSTGVQEVQIDAPLSGWHAAEGDNASFSQSVNYPASTVNMASDQNISAQIRGQIKNFTPSGKKVPGRLVVNGVSMPQRVETDGSFARPYIFSEGSNSIEVVSPDGNSRNRVQFYSTPGTGAIRARLRLVLSWDTDNTDLDMHVITPDGEHAWYGNQALNNGGALDIDVTTGYGPEIFAMPAPLKGRYLVYVNYFGGRSETELTTAQLSIITDEGSANEKQETFIVPMREAGELTLVKSFNW
ncbi:hypothetical protein CHU32_14165 [Superficieibacter electus]|uniref:DUF2135 domain-containing protein n=1 Tax=Superficieibacter electus TaxID=2022662 RepID=A0A2P5GPG5_9ENTR|nr:DUF2135 domain-containing protein [Superficieibacter electus]POP45052.1 hypothetical protein CHU33_11240 [Superficieibacter electus]POP48439.1 hypothetical protein CHU32_14165 [Superficieibacter electus]